VYCHVLYHGEARAAASPVDQAAYLVGGAFEHGLDAAVGEVSYPPGYVVLLGYPAAGVTEEHALDPARDQYPIANHKQTLPSQAATPVTGDRGR
jgi:hypothetical protein